MALPRKKQKNKTTGIPVSTQQRVREAVLIDSSPCRWEEDIDELSEDGVQGGKKEVSLKSSVFM